MYSIKIGNLVINALSEVELLRKLYVHVNYNHVMQFYKRAMEEKDGSKNKSVEPELKKIKPTKKI